MLLPVCLFTLCTLALVSARVFSSPAQSRKEQQATAYSERLKESLLHREKHITELSQQNQVLAEQLGALSAQVAELQAIVPLEDGESATARFGY